MYSDARTNASSMWAEGNLERADSVSTDERKLRIINVLCGEGGETERHAVDALLQNDADLAEWASLVRSMLDVMRADTTSSAPADVRQRAKDIFSPQPTSMAWLDTLSRVVATLVHQSDFSPVPGFRGHEETIRREFVSAAGKVFIALTPPAPSERFWRIRGMMETSDERPIEIAFIEQGSRAVSSAEFDAQAVFQSSLPRGQFQVVIRLSQHAVEIPELRIG